MVVWNACIYDLLCRFVLGFVVLVVWVFVESDDDDDDIDHTYCTVYIRTAALHRQLKTVVFTC